MNYYILTNIVLFFFFLSFFFLNYYLIKEFISKSELKLIILISIIVTVVFKFAFTSHFFGLEYEDSYIFNFSARQLSEGIYPISFLTDGIIAGSICDPISTATYGGHFITYPTFISWFYHIFGYRINFPSYINSLIELLTIFTLSISFKTIFGVNKYWFIPAIIYSLAPAMNLFGTTQLSETFSSFVILLCILSFFYYFKNKRLVVLIIFGTCFLTALLTKRENTVLVSLFIVYSLYKIVKDKKKRMLNLLPLFISFGLIILYLTLVQNIFLIEETESLEIDTKTFHISYIISLMPIFLKALINFRWFNIFLYILIFSIAFFTIKLRKNFISFTLIVLYCSFLLIYTVHYRSYYFVHFDNIKPFEALRYLNNFFVVSTIIVSLFVIELLNNSFIKNITIPVISVLLIISFGNTLFLRKQFSEIEYENRFLKPKLILEYLSKEDKFVLIADNILIFQLLGNNNLNLIDMTSLENISEKNENKYLFMTPFSQTENFQYRFPNIINKIEKLKKKEILLFESNDVLYKIE